MLKRLKPVNYYAAIINLIVIVLMVALVGIHKSLTPEIPFWFSLSWGGDRLASPYFLWLLPILVFLFFIVSYLTSKVLSKNHSILAEILVWTTTFLSFIFLLACYRITLLGS